MGMLRRRQMQVAATMGGAGIQYLLRDEFTTALTAGNVNNTSMQPGPGTRLVVDTGTFLALSGGRAACADVSGTGDPCLYGDVAVSRVAGRIALATFTPKSRGYLGYEDASSGNPTKAAISALTNNNMWVTDGGGGLSAAVVTIDTSGSTEYQIAIMLRAAGLQAFIKGGTFANWELIWVGDSDTTGTLYFGIAGRVGGADEESWDYMRVLKNRFWLASPIASDGFSLASTTDGLGHAEGLSGGLGSGGDGLPWSDRLGTWAVAGGSKSASALSGGEAICTVTLKSDIIASVKATRNAGNFGLVVRFSSTSNYVYCYHDGTNITLRKVVSGVDSEVMAATAAAYSAGTRLTVIASGTKYRIFYNDNAVGSEQTIAELTTSSRVGLYTTDTGNTFDDFTVYARGTEGEHESFF